MATWLAEPSLAGLKDLTIPTNSCPITPENPLYLRPHHQECHQSNSYGISQAPAATHGEHGAEYTPALTRTCERCAALQRRTMVGHPPIARNLNVRVAYPRLNNLDQRFPRSRLRHRMIDHGEVSISSQLRSLHSAGGTLPVVASFIGSDVRMSTTHNPPPQIGKGKRRNEIRRECYSHSLRDLARRLRRPAWSWGGRRCRLARRSRRACGRLPSEGLPAMGRKRPTAIGYNVAIRRTDRAARRCWLGACRNGRAGGSDAGHAL